MKYIAILFLSILFSCGMEPREETIIERPTGGRTPGGVTSGGGVDPDRQALGFLQENCAGCHPTSNYLKSKRQFCNSQALNRVKGSSMPLKSDSNYYLWQDGTRRNAVVAMCNR